MANRSAHNARRHGLTARLRSTDPEWARITLIAEMLLGTLPRTEQSWAQALIAASAQFELECIAVIRHRLGDAAARNDPLLRGQAQMSEAYTILEQLNALHTQSPYDNDALDDACTALFGDMTAAAARAFSDLAPALRKLERYERRAVSRRCRAFENLTALSISQPKAATT